MSDEPANPPAPTGPLDAIVRAASGRRGPAPVHLWNPPYCGDIGLEIRVDGSWWYQGSRIGRPAMVALFASVLRKDEDGATYLVTPAEKILVRVADAPFLGVEVIARGEGRDMQLDVRTNLDEWVAIGPEHPLRFEVEPGSGGLKPYVLVRGRLEARLTRAATFELLALASANDPPGVWSGGVFFEVPGFGI
jgi:hypothetical protein